MTDCKGLFGKIFGHRFQEFLIKEKYPTHADSKIELEGVGAIMAYLEVSRNHYEIRCKRCGAKCEL